MGQSNHKETGNENEKKQNDRRETQNSEKMSTTANMKTYNIQSDTKWKEIHAERLQNEQNNEHEDKKHTEWLQERSWAITKRHQKNTDT